MIPNTIGTIRQMIQVVKTNTQTYSGPSNTLVDITGLSLAISYQAGSKVRCQGLVYFGNISNFAKVDLVRNVSGIDTVLACGYGTSDGALVIDFIDTPSGQTATYRLRLHNLDDNIGGNNDTKVINPVTTGANNTPALSPATPNTPTSCLTLTEILNV